MSKGCGCIMCRLRATPAWRRWLYFNLAKLSRDKINAERLIVTGPGRVD